MAKSISKSLRGRPDYMQRLLEEYTATRDPAIRDEIVLENMVMVEHIANRFRYAGEPLDDLLQEGYIGLINAVDMFDLERGVKFATYASHAVTGAIQHYLRDKGKLIREPGWLHDLNQKINKASSQLTQHLGREPTPEEIAVELDAALEEVENALRTRDVFRVSSLEQPLGEETEDGFASVDQDKIRNQRQPEPALSLEDRMALEEALNQLKAVEKRIIYDFFFQDLTKTEIAKRLGYSCSHVSHLLRRALKELKRILMAEEREEIHRQLRALEDQVEPYAERAAEETIKDELTGLYSRSYIEARLEEEMARLDPHGQDLAVCLLQVDRLAAYAARYGRFDAHRAVSLIAQIIRETGRRVDRMGRYSEDQFILLLPHTGAPAIQLCERIRQKVAHKQFRRRDEPEARLTLSIGVAVLSPHNRTPRSLLNAAAAALARSLERGGNQIFLADEPPTYP